MKYLVYNTAQTDLKILLKHSEGKKASPIGSVGSPKKERKIPGLSKVPEGKNCISLDEDELRTLFGIFESISPGVVDPDKPLPIIPGNVKKNSRLLDSKRVFVKDERGRHILGVGGKQYQQGVTDKLQDENAMLTSQIDTLRQVLANDNFSEEQIEAILSGKKDQVEKALKSKKVTKSGLTIVGDSEPEIDGFAVCCGDEVLRPYKTEKSAISYLEKLASEKGAEVMKDESGNSLFEADGQIYSVKGN